MAVALLEPHTEETSLLSAMRSDLLAFAKQFESSYLTLSPQETAATLVEVEHLSNVIDHLQTVTARAAEDHQLATTDTRDHYKNTADYLRAKIGVSRSEANRRLRLGQEVLPDVFGPGASVEPSMATLAAATSAGAIGSRAATIIRDAVHRVSTVATRPQLATMEDHLTRQAIEADEDVLRVLARRWENLLDQDGQEPTDKILRARQGVFLRGRRNGLHFMEIGATDEQFEHLITVMNTATNPRANAGASGNAPQGAGDGGHHTDETADTGQSSDQIGNAEGTPGPDRPTHAQNLLDGLVSACRIALSNDGLPATGGHRPQVMVTINYQDLLRDLEHDGSGYDGHAVFAQQISAQSIRKIACDADILPLVLGGKGQILDIGRAQRLFPPHMRRALVARDKGCAFPDCTVPATWCEAHHIVPWFAGGTTNVHDGVLLCSRHHHVLHEGNWSIESVHGIPWFRPPKYLDPDRSLRRNRFWQVEEAVHRERARPQTNVIAEKAAR